MNRLFVVAGLAILVAALVFLNQGIKKTGQPDTDDDAPPQQTAAQSAPAAKKPAALPPSISPATLPAEQTLGNPATAKHHIVVGWSYNENNQKQPASLTTPLQAVQSYVAKSGGSASVVIVNTDVPASDRSPAAQAVTANGISVDGKPVITGDVSAAPPQKVVGAIQAAAK